MKRCPVPLCGQEIARGQERCIDCAVEGPEAAERVVWVVQTRVFVDDPTRWRDWTVPVLKRSSALRERRLLLSGGGRPAESLRLVRRTIRDEVVE